MLTSPNNFKIYQSVVTKWLSDTKGVKLINAIEKDLLASLSQRKHELDIRNKELQGRMAKLSRETKKLLKK